MWLEKDTITIHRVRPTLLRLYKWAVEKTFTFVFRLKSPPKQEWAALMLNMWDEPHPQIGEKVPVDVDCEEGTITSIFPLPAASH